ncbi:minor capsid protein [Caldifermentibacillus hisashii]|uniref:minor capsid protein n=1 Tax=Caldifermentibacillus hisashii TaxID=996558 RepID=UPI0030E98DA4
MAKKLDFMLKLNQKINSLGLFAKSTIGLLEENENISVMAMPGGEETVYFDGTRDKNYQVQVNAKSKNQMNCYDALTTIYQTLENLEELPSGNGSYEFNGIETKSLPSLLEQDEQGYFIYVLSISAKITIYKGVEI